VPQGYGPHFKSFDGKARNFIVEGNGGPSWLTEYNVLSGLSSRSFGHFSYFVTRIASGRVERGLPLALKGCGYQTLSLYPALGAFMALSQSPWYARYAALGLAPLGLTPTEDQQLAGLLMWIPGGLVHAVAALLLIAKALRAAAPPAFSKEMSSG